MTEPLLSVRDLTLAVGDGPSPVPLVRGLSFDVAPGEKLGVVGESGSGKSLTMLAIMGLLPTPPVRVVGGSVRWNGADLLRADERELRAVRGREIAMIYQDPLTSLNPIMRIGEQIVEAQRAHGVDRAAAVARANEVLAEVHMPDVARTARAYPHEFSGGMRQRVMIAMALAMAPRLLIADEPTTALDVTTQQQILRLVDGLHARTGMAVIWVTHDLGVVARLVSRVMVMYAGAVAEVGPIRDVFRAPNHPYTADLLAALPRAGRAGDERGPLRQIPGAPPEPGSLPRGCAYGPRCAHAVPRCAEEEPGLMPRAGTDAACWVARADWGPPAR